MVTKMSVLAGQGSNVSSWQELVQLLEDVHSVHRASSVLSFKVGLLLKPFHVCLWPTRTESTLSLRREGVSD